mmetsp:Transcript_13887/g.22922  ORF Transcript_13887/g.22922 Transcript_13887/m.22922 type:complete len:336 (-) Transcript_13887:2082-3089(-)
MALCWLEGTSILFTSFAPADFLLRMRLLYVERFYGCWIVMVSAPFGLKAYRTIHGFPLAPFAVACFRLAHLLRCSSSLFHYSHSGWLASFLVFLSLILFVSFTCADLIAIILSFASELASAICLGYQMFACVRSVSLWLLWLALVWFRMLWSGPDCFFWIFISSLSPLNSFPIFFLRLVWFIPNFHSETPIHSLLSRLIYGATSLDPLPSFALAVFLSPCSFLPSEKSLRSPPFSSSFLLFSLRVFLLALPQPLDGLFVGLHIAVFVYARVCACVCVCMCGVCVCTCAHTCVCAALYGQWLSWKLGSVESLDSTRSRLCMSLPPPGRLRGLHHCG